MKYCLISVAACFMPLASLAFTDIYSELPDVAGVSKVTACSGFFTGSCLSIKKQNSLRVAYPRLFKQPENNQALVITADNNLRFIIHQDKTDQYSLHFIDNPENKSAAQKNLNPYFQNLERIARSNVRIKYTPQDNALIFIHPEVSVVVTVDGLYSDLNKKAVISTLLSEKTIAVVSTIVEAIGSDIVVSPDKDSQRVPESDKGVFLEAYEGHYVFHPYPERFYPSSDHAPSIESANIEKEVYEYSLGDTYKLSFLNFGQAVIRPVGEPSHEGEPMDGRKKQSHKAHKDKTPNKAGTAGTPQGQGKPDSQGSRAGGGASGGGGKRPPRKKGEQKKHIPEDYNAPEKTAEDIDNDIQSLIQEIKETNERLASIISQNRGAQEPADTLPDAPEGAAGGTTGNRDNPVTLRRKLQELNEKLRLARERKRALEMKTRSTSGVSKSNEPGPSTSRSERRPVLGNSRFLDDGCNTPFEGSEPPEHPWS